MKTLALTPKLERKITALMALSHVPFEASRDVRQAIYLAICESWERFDPVQGVEFETFVDRRVRGAIADYARRQDTLSREDRKRVQRGEMAPPDAGIPLKLIARTRPASDRTPEQSAMLNEVRDWLRLLTGNERRVLEAYYFEERKLGDIAQELHLHLSRTAALRVQAIARLRTCLKLDRPKALAAHA